MIRIFKHYVPKHLMWLAAGEILVLLLSVYLGLRSVMHSGQDVSAASLMVDPALLSGLFVAIMLLAMFATGLYRREEPQDMSGMMLRVILSFLLGFGFVTLLCYAYPPFFIVTDNLVVTLVFAFAGVVCTRLIFRQVSRLQTLRYNILVVGTGERARELETMVRQGALPSIQIAANLKPVGEREGKILSRRILHDSANLVRIAREMNISEIVVAPDDRRGSFAADDILACKMAGIPVTNLVSFLEKQTGAISLQDLSPSHMIFCDGFTSTPAGQRRKRLFDMVSSFSLLAITLPIMFLAAAAIWVESGGRGAVLYRQERVGKHGRRFSILKFRSMRIDAEAGGQAQWARENDPRVTRVGRFIRKTRIDELPQLINVIKGDMSFVGPRPERLEFVEQLSAIIPYYGLRHSVNPGITGWAQICYPYGASTDDARQKLQYDLYYLKNYSLFLDFTILLQTAQVCLWGNGAR